MIKNRSILGIVLAMLVLLPLVSASGIATPYWNNNPLKLASGESADIQLMLQNMVGEEDITFEATISEGVATILDDPLYEVPFGSEVPVNVRVTVPEEVDVGEVYDIAISFKEVATGEGGMVRMTGAVTSRFPVEVVGEEESVLYDPTTPERNYLVWVVLALVALALILFIMNKHKKEINNFIRKR